MILARDEKDEGGERRGPSVAGGEFGMFSRDLGRGEAGDIMISATLQPPATCQLNVRSTVINSV